MVLSTLVLKFLGNDKTEALYINLDNPSDLTMLIFQAESVSSFSRN